MLCVTARQRPWRTAHAHTQTDRQTKTHIHALRQKHGHKGTHIQVSGTMCHCLLSETMAAAPYCLLPAVSQSARKGLPSLFVKYGHNNFYLYCIVSVKSLPVYCDCTFTLQNFVLYCVIVDVLCARVCVCAKTHVIVFVFGILMGVVPLFI